MREGNSLDKGVSSKDYITIYLRNSVWILSFSESDSKRFRLRFIFVELAIFAICFFHLSCITAPTTYHGVQRLLGIYLEGNQSTLVETAIHLPVYSCREWNFEPQPFLGFQYPWLTDRRFNSDQNHVSLDATDLLAHRFLAPIKRVGSLFATRVINLRIQSEESYI